MKISADLVFLDESARDAETLLRDVGLRLVEQGLARPSFVEAIVARERRFPTGVETGTVAAALPHTDPEHVEIESIAFVRPAKTVEFRAMGDPSRTVPVQAAFIMLIADGEHQVGWLQALVGVLADDVLMALLLEQRSHAAIAGLLDARLSDAR